MNFYLAVLFALFAALCWGGGPLIAYTPARRLGGFAFNRLRVCLIAVLALGVTSLTGGWATLDGSQFLWLGLSSVVGIFIGDALLFLSLSRLGPRRHSLVFSTHAPMSALLGIPLLGEVPSGLQVLGMTTIFTGVTLAIALGKQNSRTDYWENKTSRWALVLGLGAAFCQAAGALMTRPVMQAGVAFLPAFTLRIGIGALCYLLTWFVPHPYFRDKTKISAYLIWRAFLSGWVGLAMGIGFFLLALAAAPVGIVATLSSAAPVFTSLFLWLFTRQSPSFFAWLGPVLVFLGAGLLFL